MLRRSLVLAALAATLAAPAAAHADAFDDVFADYQQDGRITACKHSQGDLQSAQDQVPSDIEQYAPDFPAALEQALENRARSGCPKDAGGGRAETPASGAATPGTGDVAGQAGAVGGAAPAGGTPAPGADPATAAGATPAPGGAASTAPAAADGAIVQAATRTVKRGTDDAPAPLVVLAVLGGLLLLALLLWALLRFFALEPRWLASARHATGEAGWRTSAAWDDFTDWLGGGRSSSPR